MMIPTFRTLLGCCLLLLLAALSSAMPQSNGGAGVRIARQAADVQPPVRIAGGRNAFFPGVGAVGSFSNSLSISDRNIRRPPIVFGRRPQRFNAWYR